MVRKNSYLLGLSLMVVFLLSLPGLPGTRLDAQDFFPGTPGDRAAGGGDNRPRLMIFPLVVEGEGNPSAPERALAETATETLEMALALSGKFRLTLAASRGQAYDNLPGLFRRLQRDDYQNLLRGRIYRESGVQRLQVQIFNVALQEEIFSADQEILSVFDSLELSDEMALAALQKLLKSDVGFAQIRLNIEPEGVPFEVTVNQAPIENPKEPIRILSGRPQRIVLHQKRLSGDEVIHDVTLDLKRGESRNLDWEIPLWTSRDEAYLTEKNTFININMNKRYKARAVLEAYQEVIAALEEARAHPEWKAALHKWQQEEAAYKPLARDLLESRGELAMVIYSSMGNYQQGEGWFDELYQLETDVVGQGGSFDMAYHGGVLTLEHSYALGGGIRYAPQDIPFMAFDILGQFQFDYSHGYEPSPLWGGTFKGSASLLPAPGDWRFRPYLSLSIGYWYSLYSPFASTFYADLEEYLPSDMLTMEAFGGRGYESSLLGFDLGFLLKTTPRQDLFVSVGWSGLPDVKHAFDLFSLNIGGHFY